MSQSENAPAVANNQPWRMATQSTIKSLFADLKFNRDHTAPRDLPVTLDTLKAAVLARVKDSSALSKLDRIRGRLLSQAARVAAARQEVADAEQHFADAIHSEPEDGHNDGQEIGCVRENLALQ